MPTAARVRKPVDVQRLGEAVSFPGIDPRTWVAAARVDDDSEAVRWDVELGQIVDVTFYGGGLDQDSEVPCRVVHSLAGNGFGESRPIDPGCEVAVLVVDGDPNANPVVVGQLHNAEDCKAPLTVNGLPIAGDTPLSTPFTVSPFDTELKVSPYNRREQYAGLWHLQADEEAVVTSDDIRLGSEDATEPALLGQVTIDNTDELIVALIVLADSFIPLTGPLLPLSAIGTALKAALVTLQPKIPLQATDKVKLE